MAEAERKWILYWLVTLILAAGGFGWGYWFTKVYLTYC